MRFPQASRLEPQAFRTTPITPLRFVLGRATPSIFIGGTETRRKLCATASGRAGGGLVRLCCRCVSNDDCTAGQASSGTHRRRLFSWEARRHGESCVPRPPAVRRVEQVSDVGPAIAGRWFN